MAEWTQKQSTDFTELYKQLAKLPNYEKIKDSVDSQLFPRDEPLEYKEAESKLLSLISEHRGKGGLEEKVNGAPPPKKAKNSSWLAPVTAAAVALMMMYAGLPPVY